MAGGVVTGISSEADLDLPSSALFARLILEEEAQRETPAVEPDAE